MSREALEEAPTESWSGQLPQFTFLLELVSENASRTPGSPNISFTESLQIWALPEAGSSLKPKLVCFRIPSERTPSLEANPAGDPPSRRHDLCPCSRPAWVLELSSQEPVFSKLADFTIIWRKSQTPVSASSADSEPDLGDQSAAHKARATEPGNVQLIQKNNNNCHGATGRAEEVAVRSSKACILRMLMRLWCQQVSHSIWTSQSGRPGLRFIYM